MNEIINLYVTKQQKQQLKNESNATGLSMSAIVKILINQHYRGIDHHEN